MPFRPLVLAIVLAFGIPMTACAQPQTSTAGEVPATGTLLSVSASADAKRVLEQNAPQHPWLHGKWPNDRGIISRLNPFTGDAR